MHAIGGFLIRLIAYALVLGIASRVADALWVQYGLDGSIELQPLHDLGLDVLTSAPLVLALAGGRLRSPAIFLAAFLAAAALTAPLACAHVTGL